MRAMANDPEEGAPVVTFAEGSDGAVLDGLTITGGVDQVGGGVNIENYDEVTLTIRHCTITSNIATVNGGGIHLGRSNGLRLIDCDVVHNTADGWGGGIWVTCGATLDVERSTFRDNVAAESGGGICVNQGSTRVEIRDSVIRDNRALGGDGGGIFAQSDAVVCVSGSRIEANTASRAVGGVALNGGVSLTLEDTDLGGNTAQSDQGGGLATGGRLTAENSAIAGNAGSTHGGGLWLMHQTHELVNCHVVGDYTTGQGGAIATGHSPTVLITNTLVISNTGQTGLAERSDTGSVISLFYCDTFGNAPDGVEGVPITRDQCLGADPQAGMDPLLRTRAFTSLVGPSALSEWASYDYRLGLGSPCIDAGTNEGAPDVDREGDARPLDGDWDGTPVVDIGADEFVSKRILVPLAFRAT